jgi:hypothetical protein
LFDEFLGLVDILVENLGRFRSHSQIRINRHVRVNFQKGISFLSRLAAIFAPTDLFDVGAFPGVFFLHFLHDIFLVDEHKTIKTELFLA